MDEKKERTHIVNHNHNCQVFNGDMYGCVFAMPGSHVDNRPVQVVQGNNTTDSHDLTADTEAPADKPQEDEPQDNGEDKMPAELMAKVREKAQDLFDDDYCTDDGLNMVYAAARKCQAPQHFALLYLLCKDYHIVKYINCHRQFAHIINTMLNRQKGENGYLIPNSLGTSKSNITHYFEEPDKHQHIIKEYRYFYAAINRVFAEAKGVKLQRDKRCLICI